jgi:hypothetical protein
MFQQFVPATLSSQQDSFQWSMAQLQRPEKLALM